MTAANIMLTVFYIAAPAVLFTAVALTAHMAARKADANLRWPERRK